MGTGMGHSYKRPRASRSRGPYVPVHDREARCSSGKLVITQHRFLTPMASSFARELNARGEYAPDFYGYHCPWCGKWHLTKMSEFNGVANELVHVAAPLALQAWAMPVNPAAARYATDGNPE